MINILKYAILGLINRGEITGYDITKEFNERTMANFWYAKHSQVYPELKKLVDDGTIEFKTVIQGEKLEKKLYSITQKGKDELKAWLLIDEPIAESPKDVFRLRSYFSENISSENYINLLHSQIDMHNERLGYLADIMVSTYDKVPEKGTAELGDYMVLEGAIIREKTYIAWLYRCLSYSGEKVSKDKLTINIK